MPPPPPAAPTEPICASCAGDSTAPWCLRGETLLCNACSLRNARNSSAIHPPSPASASASAAPFRRKRHAPSFPGPAAPLRRSARPPKPAPHLRASSRSRPRSGRPSPAATQGADHALGDYFLVPEPSLRSSTAECRPQAASGVPGMSAAFHAVVVRSGDGGAGRVVMRPLRAGSAATGGPVADGRPFMGPAPFASGADYVLGGRGGVPHEFEQSERYTEYLRQRWRGVRSLHVEFDAALGQFVSDMFGREGGKSGWAKARALVTAVVASNPGLDGRLLYSEAKLEGWKCRLEGYGEFESKLRKERQVSDERFSRSQ